MPKFKAKVEKQFNISPLDKSLVLMKEGQKLKFDSYTWGLLPANSKSHINQGTLYNAMIESLPSSPSFRIPYRMKRCLIPADSYYNFETINSKTIPYRISLRNGKAMFFAGMHEEWKNSLYHIKTFTIITAPTSQAQEHCGTRMPIIFQNLNDGISWMSCNHIRESLDMLKTPSPQELKIYRITDEALNPEYNNPEIHEEYHKEMTLFDSI